jgi:hypothetical protein
MIMLLLTKNPASWGESIGFHGSTQIDRCDGMKSDTETVTSVRR